MTINDMLLSIVAGVASSLLAIFIVWLNQVLKQKIKNRKLKIILDLAGSECLISVPSIRSFKGSVLVAHQEIYAFGFLSDLVRKIGVEPVIIPASNISDNQALYDEFCVGGPPSNARTDEILKTYIPDFEFVLTENALGEQDPSKGWIHGYRLGEKLTERNSRTEYCFLAKIRTVYGQTIHLVFGITGLGSSAAAYYLKKNASNIYKMFGEKNYFLVLRYTNRFGYGSVHKLIDASAYIKTNLSLGNEVV